MINFSKSNINGEINANPSKSVEQRLLCAAMLSHNESVIENFGSSDDVVVARNIIENFGCKINYENSLLIIKPKFNQINELFCGESATCARLFTPIACLNNMSFRINGKATLMSRGIANSFSVLETFGSTITYERYSNLPIFITKPELKPGVYVFDSISTSQIFSGLLMALPLLNDNSELHINNPKSVGYIYLTISVLNDFGVIVNHKCENSKLILKIPGNQKYKAGKFVVESDWSGAAFFIVLAAINGCVQINNLNFKSLQPDLKILDLLKLANVHFIISDCSLKIKKSKIKYFKFDANNCPDLIPISIILAIFADNISYIYGANRLKTKESSRAEVMKTEMAKAGIKIEIENDLIKVCPQTSFISCDFNSYGDHRIAMALSIFSVSANGKFSIDNADCVSKSYPVFFDDLKSLGGKFYE
jgi:3-phosphoshikimate 1-carboxyvinyltransferase